MSQEPSRVDRVLDVLERAVIVGLFGGLAVRLASSFSAGKAGDLLLLISEGLVVVFMLFRRPAREASREPIDWLMAFGATCAPLLVSPTLGRPWLPETVGASLLVMGTIVQIHAKLALGRSFGCVAAHRGLKTAGPYRFVRHPMYAGYILSHVGFLALNPTWTNLWLYLACDGLQIPRILAEERILARDANYLAYKAEVKYRLFPRIF
jgi:protein-S-isoprenylcysteine O-methyltransferase Ste14